MRAGSSGSGRSRENDTAAAADVALAGKAAPSQEEGKGGDPLLQQQQREVSPLSDGGSGMSGGLGTQLGELFEHLTADMVKDGMLPAAQAAAAAAAAAAKEVAAAAAAHAAVVVGVRSSGGLLQQGKVMQGGAPEVAAVQAAAAAAADDAAAAAAGIDADGGDMHAALDTAALFAFAGGESD
jgi:hypothetical protein